MGQWTEKQVAKIIPKGSTLLAYVKYACYRTDAHIGYHVSNCMTALSILAPPSLACELHGAGMTTPCLYSMCVGESRQDRKTTAINITRGFIEEVAPELIGPAPGSSEGFLESLSEQPQQLIIYGEMGSFLKDTAGGYLSRLRTTYMEAYDGQTMGRRLAHDLTEIGAPRVAIIGGITPGLLEEFTTPADWSNGFFGRITPAFFSRERTWPLPKTPPDGLYTEVVDHFRRFRLCEAGQFIGFTPEAACYWAGNPDAPEGSPERLGWFARISDRYQAGGVHQLAYALCGGTPGMALKFAMLFAHDFGETARERWIFSLRALKSGCDLAEMVLDCQLRLIEAVGMSGYARERRAVLAVFARDERPRTMGEIMAEIHPPMDVRNMKRVLESMSLSGHLHLHGGSADDGGGRYSTRDPGWNAVDLDGAGEVVPLDLARERKRQRDAAVQGEDDDDEESRG